MFQLVANLFYRNMENFPDFTSPVHNFSEKPLSSQLDKNKIKNVV